MWWKLGSEIDPLFCKAPGSHGRQNDVCFICARCYGRYYVLHILGNVWPTWSSWSALDINGDHRSSALPVTSLMATEYNKAVQQSLLQHVQAALRLLLAVTYFDQTALLRLFTGSRICIFVISCCCHTNIVTETSYRNWILTMLIQFLLQHHTCIQACWYHKQYQ